MKEQPKFKFLYWAMLTVLVLILAAVAALTVLQHGDKTGLDGPLILLPIFILIPLVIFAISRWVYKDATSRGMEPWLWMTVAVFVPNLIGVIIYLVVRQNYKSACTSCGKGIQKDFNLCPYCGESQDLNCEKCKKPIAPDWKNCPYCSHPLPVKADS